MTKTIKSNPLGFIIALGQYTHTHTHAMLSHLYVEAIQSAARTLPLAKQQLVIQDHILFFLFTVHIKRKRNFMGLGFTALTAENRQASCENPRKSVHFQSNCEANKVGKAGRRALHRLSKRKWWGTESSVRYVKSMRGDRRIFLT